MKLSVVIPIYNESSTLAELFKKLQGVIPQIASEWELILVNDGSSDNSLSIIKQYAEKNDHIKWIDFSRNFGHQSAMSAGIEYSTGDGVVTMDGDLQDPPELIPKLVEMWKSDFKVVYARRIRRKGETWTKRVTAYLFYRFLKQITTANIPMDVGDFRLIDRSVVNQLRKMPEPRLFLRGQIAWLGFPSGFVEFERAERFAGESKYTFRKIIQLALNGIWGFSKFPIILLWWFAAFLFIALLITLALGWLADFDGIFWQISLLVLIAMTGQAICLALLGEYIYRIFDINRARPDYLVKNTNI